MNSQKTKRKAVLIMIPVLLLLGCRISSPSTQDPNGKKLIPEPDTSVEMYKYVKPEKALRILTYNSFYCKSNTPKKEFSEQNVLSFAEVIKYLDADIVAIQELDSAVVSRNSRYLLDQIAQKTGVSYQVFFGSAAKYGGGKIGCGLLVKSTLPVRKVKYVDLPGKEARKLIIAELADCAVMATHLDLDNSSRKRSAEIIVHEMDAVSSPLFLMGDLNDSPMWDENSSAFPILKKSFSLLSDTNDKVSIDHILVDSKSQPGLRLKGTAVVKKLWMSGAVKDLEPISDHYPVYVDVEIKK